MFEKIADKVGIIPLPYFACGALLFVALVAGCDSAYAGCGGSLGLNAHCGQQVQQVVVPVYQQQLVQRVVVPQRVVVQQVQQHHLQQQAVVVQKVQVQKPQRQVVRQRIVTRSR